MEQAEGSGLWAFAVALYGRPGVADHCLTLQDRSGVDVPVLLFAAWLAGRGVTLDPPAVQRIEALIGAWRREVVQPLRAVRRRLKAGPAPGPTAETEAVRNTVKAAELSAERIELAWLEVAGLQMPAGAAGPEILPGNLARVVEHYRGSPPDAADRAALADIAAALS